MDAKYYGDDPVKKGEMGGACSTYGENINTYRVLVGGHEEKRARGKPRHIWKGNIKMDEFDICGTVHHHSINKNNQRDAACSIRLYYVLW